MYCSILKGEAIDVLLNYHFLKFFRFGVQILRIFNVHVFANELALACRLYFHHLQIFQD